MHTCRGSVERECYSLLCIEVNSPRSLGAFLRLKYQEELLLELDWAPSDYNDVEDFRRDYLIMSFLSKWKGLRSGIDTESAAITAWERGESICYLTNQVFRDYSFGRSVLNTEENRVEGVLLLAKRKIADILGPCKVGSVMALCRWTQGATYDLRRGSHLDKKLSQSMSVTAGALPFLATHLSLDPHWFEALTGHFPCGDYSVLPSCFSVVKGSRMLTVPKNAKTDRVIAAEPTGNVFLQQGVGRYIRSRLSSFSIRLDDQSINQKLAARAASEGLATLDLSMASDTISRNFVYEMLPTEWYTFLDQLRSHYTEYQGQWCPLEKFSSMGNSFTFELETLLFWALAKAAQEHDAPNRPETVSAYGDDLIIAAEAAELLVKTLEACGFAVNREKSFFTGRFFESCGRHYFDGCDVTPVYQREIANSLQEHVRLHNRLYRWADTHADHVAIDAAMWARQTFPGIYYRKVRCFIEPLIPASDPSDDGYLTEPFGLQAYERNHGYQLWIFSFRPWTYRPTDEMPFFAYKLRAPQAFSYSDPKGQGEIGTLEGRWVMSQTWRHHYSTTTD